MCSNPFRHVHMIIVLLFVISHFAQISSQLGSKVEQLPGFEGPLPFELETGYVGLGETDDDEIEVFYYFVKSENNPQEDPLFLWLTGGPGCSSISGLLFQVGPIAFKTDEYDGGMPKLVLRPESWTKVSSFIFVDLPIGTGFSYAKNLYDHRSDWKVIHHAHHFLRKWLIDHPEFLSNEFYIGADSYSGIPAPAIVQEISNGNEIGLQPRINLQGYLLGNLMTSLRKERNDKIPFAHGMGLISDELYVSLQRNCKGDYTHNDSRNELCSRDLNYFDECLSRINNHDILNYYCESDFGLKQEVPRRSLAQKFEASLNPHMILPDKRCQAYNDMIVNQWANDESVRKSLHIREGTIDKWERCYRTEYEFQIPSSFEFHVNVSAKGYRSLIHSGDKDAIVPFLSTQAWIRALNYSIVDDWRPWLVNNQVAGYTRTYSNQMTFATIKGAGHVATYFKIEECFTMFTRWIAKLPL